MPKTRSLQLSCPECGGKKFEISVMKVECVGVTKCLKCERNYLLLDSEDYWFDVIQQKQYPRPSRCGCKGTVFHLRLDYEFRDNESDVGFVEVLSTCSDCGKSRRQLNVEIDYSPTEHLVDQPLTYCKNPKIFYDLHELTLYAKRADIAQVVHYLGDAGYHFAGCMRQDGEWVVRHFDVQAAAEAIVNDGESSSRFRWIYASDRPIKVSELAVATPRDNTAFWKRSEIIRISAPLYMVFGSISMRPSLLYYIHFSNEYVLDECVIAKSQRFRNLTSKLIEWLQDRFVTWRGKDCFDNEQEHLRAFGKKFRPKKS